MPDPVSWLMIKPGWKVLAADGSEAGKVEEVLADGVMDIFTGVTIATSPFSKPRYVPAEQIGGIYEGELHLKLTREQAEHLGEYVEPTTSAAIEREIEHPPNIWRRIALFLRR